MENDLQKVVGLTISEVYIGKDGAICIVFVGGKSAYIKDNELFYYPKVPVKQAKYACF